jgi:hypothetical protein
MFGFRQAGLFCLQSGPLSLPVEVAAMSSKFWLYAAAIVVLSGWSAAAERLPTPADADDSVSDQIATLISQLDAPAFGDRQAASQQLEDLGAAAAAHLELAIKSGSREASARALDILRRHFEQGSDDARQASRSILSKLAESNSASIAQKARDALDPPKVPAYAEPAVNVFGNGGFQRMQNLQVVIGGGGRSVTISDVNGRRSMEITDARRQVTLQTQPGGKIDVEISDRKNVKNAKQKITANDIDELKRKDAEIGRLYEQFSRITPVPRFTR